MYRENRTAVVIYEDRTDHEVGVKLLILSLESHFPEASIHVFLPNASEGFQEWVTHHPVLLHRKLETELVGFNAKPYTLLWALAQDYERAIWIDSDIILSRSLPQSITTFPPDVMVVAETPGIGKIDIRERIVAWNLKPGRKFPHNPSACYLSVTQVHQKFLEQWQTMLHCPDYQYWLTHPSKERPIQFSGSDASFMALLGSQDYEHLPVKLLKKGRDIAQCLTWRGYTVSQRLTSFVSGIPPLIHAMGEKPWLVKNYSGSNYRAISPYACVARAYKDNLGQNEQDWLEIPEGWLKKWDLFVQGNPALSSLPLALWAQLPRRLLRLFSAERLP